MAYKGSWSQKILTSIITIFDKIQMLEMKNLCWKFDINKLHLQKEKKLGCMSFSWLHFQSTSQLQNFKAKNFILIWKDLKICLLYTVIEWKTCFINHFRISSTWRKIDPESFWKSTFAYCFVGRGRKNIKTVKSYVIFIRSSYYVCIL